MTINGERRSRGLSPFQAVEGITHPDVHPFSLSADAYTEPSELDQQFRPQPARSSDHGMVLRAIRALLMLSTFVLCGILAALLAIGYNLRDSTALAVAGPQSMVLNVTGDPAVEAWAHLFYADGTQRDVGPGVYTAQGVVRIEMRVAADVDGAGTGCRITLDNALVAEGLSDPGGEAVCRWSAP